MAGKRRHGPASSQTPPGRPRHYQSGCIWTFKPFFTKGKSRKGDALAGLWIRIHFCRSGSSSFSECGSGSSFTKFVKKNYDVFFIKHIKIAQKWEKKKMELVQILIIFLVNLQVLAIFLAFFCFYLKIFPPGSWSAYWCHTHEGKCGSRRIRIPYHSPGAELMFYHE